MKKNILNVLSGLIMLGIFGNAFGENSNQVVSDAGLGPNPLWTIKFKNKKNIHMLDYRYFWVGGPTLLSYTITAPLPEIKEENSDSLDSVSLPGKLPSGPVYVEWTNSIGYKYIYLIPVKELVEKNGLNYKKRLELQFLMEPADSFSITAKDLFHPNEITLFSSKSLNNNILDLTNGDYSFPLISFNYQVPSGFDTSSVYIDGIPEINNLPYKNGYKPQRGTNPLPVAIRSGMFIMYQFKDIKDSIFIEWTDSKSGQLISYKFNLKEKLKELGLTSKNVENSIYSFKKEILFRINKDNSLDVLFVTKELYANSENKNQENPILILNCHKEKDDECQK